MINYTTKFDIKANNIAFFINEKLDFKNSANLKSLDNKKILLFLKKNKDIAGKKILTFDLSENQRCLFIITKKKLQVYEINSLGAYFKSVISTDKSIKKVNIFSKLNFRFENISEENFIN